MKFSVNWLREFVELPPSVDALADLLTMAGVEIKSIEQRGAKIDNVVVAQIASSAQHPNADRLSVCEVDDGTGMKRQIVCGAKNYQVGDKVLLAQPGAKLPNGMEIRKSKLRGVDSEGMLCSPIELGLGEDASGILILSQDAKIGAPMADLFPSDTILDVEITPNRGDLLSHFGLAREIAALTDVVAAAVPGGRTKIPLPPATAAATIKIFAPTECPFFSARRIDNVKVGPSPQWLRAKVESVGMRSINNIVDISNFVMAELGQPTHAFDADKLHGGINVRLARDDEKFLALDGKTYSLKPDNCVVADKERAVGIGGVMGGEETGVTESTENILLEAAYFLPASIRRTSRDLSLPSDASYRFERGVDPQMVLRASERVTELIREIAGGSPAKEIMTGGDLPANPADVSLSYAKCDRVLGTVIKPAQIDQILERFGLDKKKSEKTKSNWKIPSHRSDLQRDVDLVEEVMRAYGVENIPGKTSTRFAETSRADRVHDFHTLILRERLAGFGLSEVRTSKLIPQSAVDSTAIKLRNPLSEDHVALRPNLISGLLAVLDRNVRAGADRVAIFEIGRIFLANGKDKPEPSHLGILLWGAASAPQWRTYEKRLLDFFDLKGVIESLTRAELSFRKGEYRDFAMATQIWSGDHEIGIAGQLTAARAREVGAPGAILIGEIDVDLVLDKQESAKRFREIEKLPAITRDIAMIVPEKISHEDIERVIRSEREPLLESVKLFDLFEGSEIGPARKSLAYSLTYRDKIRTLTNEEVTAAHAKIRERLQRELGAELRE